MLIHRKSAKLYYIDSLLVLCSDKRW